MRYRITGLTGDSKGQSKRVLITTANSRKEALHVARRSAQNFAKVRIEPVSESQERKAGRGFGQIEDDASAERARARRVRKGRVP